MGTSDMLDSVHMSLQKIFQSVNNSYKIILLAHDELAGLPNILKSLEDTNVKVKGGIMIKNKLDNYTCNFKTYIG